MVKEEYDKFKYSAKEIIVPSAYNCQNGSHKKMRALHYAIQRIHQLGYGKETYILHLDDDSIVSKSYIEYVRGMEEEAGQGSIRLRGYGQHLMSTLADMIRVSDCVIYCNHANDKKKPIIVHGEGLVIRADIEYEIGWDFGGYGADDLIMGLSIRAKGYSFGRIPDYIYISPPMSTMDFYKQRRRWSYSIMSNRKTIYRLNKKTMLFTMYKYIIGTLGIIGLIFWGIDILMGVSFPFPLTIIGIYNMAVSIIIYEYGVFNTNKKYALSMLLLLIPVAFYEGGTFIYMMLRPPKKDTFDVIKKARL